MLLLIEKEGKEMRNIEKKEMEQRFCTLCDHCHKANGVYYCEKAHCPFSDEDFKDLKDNEKK